MNEARKYFARVLAESQAEDAIDALAKWADLRRWKQVNIVARNGEFRMHLAAPRGGGGRFVELHISRSGNVSVVGDTPDDAFSVASREDPLFPNSVRMLQDA